MKIKHVLASLGLAMTTAFALAVGVGAKKEAKSVKAEGEKWMVTICFDNTVPEESEEWGYIDGQGVNFWGTGVTYADSYEALHQSGLDHFYTVNVVFTSEQTVTGMQLSFYEDGVKKESQDITVELDSSRNGQVFTYAFPEEASWEDGKWSVSQVSVNQTPSGDFDDTQLTFTPDPETKSYYVKNVELEAEKYIALCPFTYTAHNWNDTAAVVREDAEYRDLYFQRWHGDHWFEMKVSGTFDFFLTNEYVDGGILDVRKHEDALETCIYYVLEDNQATNDYIYTWGGSEQFGAWPGTKITEIENVKEVTGNGVLHFEGSETPKLIYRIPVSIGYPAGDSHFKFNNNNDWESEARPLVSGAAYWHTGDANEDAGLAIEFLVQAEYCRNTATDYSVCNISVNEAKVLVNSYNGLSAGVRDYIDRSSVYTYARSGEGNALVSYRDVMVQIALIAEISLVGSSMSFYNFSYDYNNTSVVAIIIVIAAVSMVALGTLLILKKKRK